jgi:hypothetical protein
MAAAPGTVGYQFSCKPGNNGNLTVWISDTTGKELPIINEPPTKEVQVQIGSKTFVISADTSPNQTNTIQVKFIDVTKPPAQQASS